MRGRGLDDYNQQTVLASVFALHLYNIFLPSSDGYVAAVAVYVDLFSFTKLGFVLWRV